MRARTKIFVALIVLTLAPVGMWVAWRAVREPRPEAVFLIVIDTLRPDRLSCYGYQAHTTPSIDSLADQGVLFEHAHSVASWTVPSMGAMLTSLYPTRLGLVELPAPKGKRFEVREKRGQRSYTIPEDALTLAEIMKSAGFHTAGFVDQPLLNSGDGYLQGFMDWFCPLRSGSVGRFDPTSPEHAQRWPNMRGVEAFDAALVKEFDAWLGKSAGSKLFAWVHLLTPHRPYKPIPKYDPPEPRTRTRRYDGEVRTVDDMLGAMLSSIDRHVGLDRSLIVFTSDHGEAFGEHGMEEHGHSLHREVVRVPLIIASSGLPKGRTIDTHVRTIDILPTILDLIGKSSLAPRGIDGSSLVSAAHGDGVDRTVFTEGMLYGSTERSLLMSPFKLMYDAQDETYSLYNVQSDPNETIDLAAQKPVQTAFLRNALRDQYARMRDDRLRAPVQNGDSQIDPSTLDALRALGYAGD